LIDEFQDISPARADLVKAIRSKGKDCALFAVGDDWQSIYRFAGADIGSMTKFGDVFGSHTQVPLDTTFRFDSQSVEASSAFILKNRAQIPKSLMAIRDADEPSLVIYRREGKDQPLDWSLDDIARQAPGGASVLVLERYNFHLPDGSELARLRAEYPQLDLKCMSIHASKGLEADYVLIGMRGGQWGFPSQIVDDPIFDMVLTQADQYPHGEERRLFYVALTRAKRKTYLVCETGQSASEFATEMAMGVEYPKILHGIEEATLACRSCGSGTMQLRDGANGKFYGCSNFPLCENIEQTCPNCGLGLMQLVDGSKHLCSRCGHTEQACPKCKSGRLALKNGQHGPFYGCSNYRDPAIQCRHTQQTLPTMASGGFPGKANTRISP
jgi:DNA helicase-4